MEHTSHEFLLQLLETPSPSGFEQSIQQVVRNHARTFADEVRTDSHGNVFAVRHPEGQRCAAHHARGALRPDRSHGASTSTSNGFLYVQPIGGWDMQILLGQALTVWTKDGAVTGVVARRAIHLLTSRMNGTRCPISPMSGSILAPKNARRRRNRSSGWATRYRSRSATAPLRNGLVGQPGDGR